LQAQKTLLPENPLCDKVGCRSLPDPGVTESFAAEAAKRQAYRNQLERLREYVSMGEGIQGTSDQVERVFL
jgi:hypothetical protein